jgi:hypothetical protein
MNDAEALDELLLRYRDSVWWLAWWRAKAQSEGTLIGHEIDHEMVAACTKECEDLEELLAAHRRTLRIHDRIGKSQPATLLCTMRIQ